MLRLMHSLAIRLRNLFEDTLAARETRAGIFQAANVRGSARHFLIAYMFARAKTRPLIVLCESGRQAESTRAHVITAWRLLTDKYERDDDFLLYPDFEPSNIFDFAIPDIETTAQRRLALDLMLREHVCVIFTTPSAIFRRLPDPETVRDAKLTLCAAGASDTGRFSVRTSISTIELAERLSDFGYERANLVFAPAQFSIRGGLVDVFPVGAASPIRIDFFGDEIEEISRFNPETQRSFEGAGEAVILPARARAAHGKDAMRAADLVKARLDEYVGEYGSRLPASVKKLSEVIEEDIERIRIGTDFNRAGFYSPLFTGDYTLLDYFPNGTSLLIHDEALVEGELRTYLRFWEERFLEWRKSALSITQLDDYYIAPDEKLFDYFRNHRLISGGDLSLILTNSFDFAHSDIPTFDMHLGTPSSAKFRLGFLTATLSAMGEQANEVWIASQFANRLQEKLKEEGITGTAVNKAILPGGFSFPDAGHLITDAEIFGEIEDTVTKRPRRYEKGGIKAVDEIKIGDYVVHIDYGVGRFVALSDQEVGGIRRSYVEIEYEGKDKLYVPVDQLDRVRRYRFDGNAPKLNNLGRRTWKKIRRKIRKDSIKLALKLFKLYRKRADMSGMSYCDSEGWLDEFGAAFPYELTPDQREAWDAVREDMEASRPMERLICGDVGFGKTEIALRTAFLTCQNDRQVLVLCPTTILADQHYHTFRRRFAAFPFRVEMLSRFLSPRDQKAIVADFNAGKVDVLIGTHRIFSKDVKPKSPGLLVIDEEQRFGVKQKERLKMKFPGVDSLTLTATPIPRTLHMSLVGMRDVSLIETPPVDRKPVRTYVGEYDRQIARDAILREIGRGGQIYFLHNRVEDIELFKAELEHLVPEAKITIAHGQMKEDALEEIMNTFAIGAFHILLATTIIENGLDIPNVNTLIVDKAENLGLAQMHQLRGRVGRSHVQAYAYFFHEPERGLTPDAQGRLHSIYNYAYLGSGYEIAQSDLRLRGAGNIFGTEQSGIAAQVGYDYYFEILHDSFEAVREGAYGLDDLDDFDEGALLDAFEEERAGCVVDVPIPAFIPPDYIEDSVLRLDLLRRIAGLNLSEIDDFRSELEDRFGKPPEAVENLLAVIAIKLMAESVGISSVEYMRHKNAFRFRFRSGRPSWVQKITLLDRKAELKENDLVDLGVQLDSEVAPKLMLFLERLEGLQE